MFARKYRDSGVSTESKERNGSGDEVNNGNFTLPLRQHNPGVSPANFNAPQYARKQRPFDQCERKGAICNQLYSRIQTLLDSN